MDRRTILFSILVFATLFLVNMYFDSEHEKQIQQWKITQEVKKKQQIISLESEIAKNQSDAEKLPLYTAFAEEQAKTILARGVFSKDAFLTIAWSEALPETLYIRPEGGDAAPKALKLAFNPKKIGSPAVYQENKDTPLLIGNLPELGNYKLQAVIVNDKENLGKPQISLAEYNDGQVVIAQDKLQALKEEITSDKSIKPEPLTGDAILLMKSDADYLPVAVYSRKDKHVTYLEDVPDLKVAQFDSKEAPKAHLPAAGGQKFYVLENEYQQLVFSNVGGSLVEINLPFSSETNKASAVRPIEFDSDIKEHHPYNGYFPANPYFTASSSPNSALIEHEKGQLGGYYPLIRRSLIEDGKRPSVKVSPRYYALNLVSEYPELAELQYTVKEFTDRSITFEGQQRQRKITKTFSLPNIDAPYTFDLKINVEGDKRALWLSSGVPEVELFSGAPDPVLKYRITRNQKAVVETIGLPETSVTNNSANPDWLCNSNGFFGIIVDPLTPTDAGYKATQVSGQAVPSRIVEVDQTHDRYEAKNFPGYLLMTPIKSSVSSVDYRIFAGPFSGSVLKQVDAIYSDQATNYNPDYIACQSYHGWFSFISEPFAKLLFVVMNFFHTITGSWAFSIILLTAFLRLLLYPLNAWSTRSMLKMQQIAPLVTAIQEKYKKDPKKMQAEVMNLYREKGVNPMSGCVPMLIQMPFLIGMFDLLKTTFELRGASFIPGWIDNLTSPDVLFSWETPIFFIGNQFHLLPILLGIVMFFQQRMSTPKIDPSQMTDQQRQQRAMATLMPVIFTFMFYNFPSGLNIYWLSSMLLAMLQQWWMQSRMPKEDVNVKSVAPPQQRKS